MWLQGTSRLPYVLVGERIPPDLAVGIKRSAAKHVNVVTREEPCRSAVGNGLMQSAAET